jgi:hypothetical protein
MKSGVIIYVAGNAPQHWTEEDERYIHNSVSQADLIEIITTKTGHRDVSDAWRALLVKGMSHISCKMAIFNETGQIEFTGKSLRLCG